MQLRDLLVTHLRQRLSSVQLRICRVRCCQAGNLTVIQRVQNKIASLLPYVSLRKGLAIVNFYLARALR